MIRAAACCKGIEEVCLSWEVGERESCAMSNGEEECEGMGGWLVGRQQLGVEDGAAVFFFCSLGKNGFG